MTLEITSSTIPVVPAHTTSATGTMTLQITSEEPQTDWPAHR